MRKDILFIGAAILLGVLLGFLVVGVLASISVPNYSSMLLTHQELLEYEKMADLMLKGKTLLIIEIILALIVFFLFLSVINPNLLPGLINKAAAAKSWVIFILSIIILLFITGELTRSSALIHIGYLDTSSPLNRLNIMIVILFGILWIVAGEAGWAGDLKSWGWGKEGEKSKPVLSFIMGALLGCVISIIVALNEWVFANYIVLVSEVLDKAGEVSYLGFILIRNALIFMLGFSFAIFAGMATACAPVFRPSKERILRFIFPVIMILLLLFVITNKFNEAIRRYDWGKTSLASVIGIPEIGKEIKTVLVLKTDEVNPFAVKEWKMETEGYGYFLGRETIGVSYENLEKIEKYLVEKNGETVYNNVCRELLYMGYFKLWDTKKAHQKQAAFAYDLLLPRMILLSKFSRLPINEINYRYLLEFSNPEKFHAGGRSALNLAKAYLHFGKLEEAQTWLKTAQESKDPRTKEELKEFQVPDSVLLEGKISGKLLLNGAPLTSVKVGLFSDFNVPEKEFSGLVWANNFLHSLETDTEGRFEFTNLGEGSFFLMVLIDREVIPFDIPIEKIALSQIPGVIKIDLTNPEIDLKEINIQIVN
ncbi:MAG: hypothetical protein PHV06_03790 [bacterium]|nr:hypothetical protein [bacterium]